MISGKQHAHRLDVHPLVTLFAVIFAVFAMHRLASHELAHGGSAAKAMPVVVAGEGNADPDHHPHGTTAADKKGDGEPSPSTAQDDDLDGGVCLASLLCLFAGLLALVLRSGLPARPLLVLRGVTVGLPPAGRPADPPCLHRLSIMRC